LGLFWAIYTDLSRRLVTPNGGLEKESQPKMAETFRLRIYNTMPRLFFFLKMVVLSGGESSEENLKHFPINFGISDLGNMTMKHFCTDDG